MLNSFSLSQFRFSRFVSSHYLRVFQVPDDDKCENKDEDLGIQEKEKARFDYFLYRLLD